MRSRGTSCRTALLGSASLRRLSPAPPSKRRRSYVSSLLPSSGVARALLSGALESFAARGFKLVDAFPFKSGDSELAADHYHGPLPIFLDAGFSVLSEHRDLTVVRKLL